MSRSTDHNFSGQKSFSQTIMQGLKALGGRDVPNYTLLFLDPTLNSERGSFQAIVVPYIELGRSSECAIRYGDNFPTVSRKHAAIAWEGNQVYVKHLGKNPTLVNGNPIGGSHTLKNGDEIQLSYDGPKLRFNSNVTKTSTFKFTERMQMFAVQALRPYRRAILLLSALLLAVAGYAIYASFNLGKKIDQMDNEYTMMVDDIQAENRRMEVQYQEELKKSKDDQERQKGQISRLRSQYNQVAGESQRIRSEFSEFIRKNKQAIEDNGGVIKSSGVQSSAGIDELSDDVYFIAAMEMSITVPGEEPEVLAAESGKTLWSGTGFLTDRGRFITARHVITPWRFNWREYEANAELNNMEATGADISVKFEARSRNGDKFYFSTSEVISITNRDEIYEIEDFGKVNDAEDTSTDWAYVNVGYKKGSFVEAAEASTSLGQLQDLLVLGYSYPSQTQPVDGLAPLLSKTSVAQAGLINGVINVTNRDFGPGNSGGPVLLERNGRFVVVGIVASGVGSEIGKVVPISQLR